MMLPSRTRAAAGPCSPCSSCGTSGVPLQRPYDCLDRPPEAMSFRLAISHHSESTSPQGALEAVFRNDVGGPTVQPNEISEVLNRPMSQELLARDLTRLAYVAKDGTPRTIPIGFTWNGF